MDRVLNFRVKFDYLWFLQKGVERVHRKRTGNNDGKCWVVSHLFYFLSHFVQIVLHFYILYF